MKRLNFYTIPVIILLCFGLTMGVSMLTGYWATERAKLPRAVDGSFDPYDIRGSYSIGEVMDIFGIPKEDFYTGLGLPSAMCSSTQLKELEKEIERVDANGNPIHFGVSDVREWVATYIGWTGPVPAEADHSTEEPSVPVIAPVESSPAAVEENTTTTAAPEPAKEPTLTPVAVPAKTSIVTPAPDAPEKTPVAAPAAVAPTPAPASPADETPAAATPTAEVTAPTATAPAEPAAAETHTPTPQGSGQGQGQYAQNPAEHTEEWTDPRGGTPLSVVYGWSVTREMLEKEYNINFDEKGLTPESTLKDLATAAGVGTSEVRDFVSRKMKK